ncbi:MAG: hypothetical protein PHV30_07480 [Candidatus Margulisbacteria bacterium]|nr:hypothetical protein [Candidatus Margulisiibacteriota bacterium]
MLLQKKVIAQKFQRLRQLRIDFSLQKQKSEEKILTLGSYKGKVNKENCFEVFKLLYNYSLLPAKQKPEGQKDKIEIISELKRLDFRLELEEYLKKNILKQTTDEIMTCCGILYYFTSSVSQKNEDIHDNIKLMHKIFSNGNTNYQIKAYCAINIMFLYKKAKQQYDNFLINHFKGYYKTRFRLKDANDKYKRDIKKMGGIYEPLLDIFKPRIFPFKEIRFMLTALKLLDSMQGYMQYERDLLERGIREYLSHHQRFKEYIPAQYIGDFEMLEVYFRSTRISNGNR